MKSSIGFHTLTISQRLTLEEGLLLLKDFQNDEEVYIFINENRLSPNADKFTEYLNSFTSKYYHIKYKDKYKGISWCITLSKMSPKFIDNKLDTDESKPCSIKATINPKVLAGIKDYVTAADINCLETLRNNFNFEAKRISSLLKSFESYHLNRIDYCVNLHLNELKIKCDSGQIMALLKQSDIPHHFSENPEYENSLYLKTKSIKINCYDKNYQLHKKFKDAPNIQESSNIIRFEIQCMYPEINYLSKKIEDSKKLNIIELLSELLSFDMIFNLISKYYYKTIRKGNYYTLEEARKNIQSQLFFYNKEVRLISALELVNEHQGIAKAKSTLTDKELNDFKRSLNDLDELKINPVTIPKDWGIKNIPNLLNNYIDELALYYLSQEMDIITKLDIEDNN